MRAEGQRLEPLPRKSLGPDSVGLYLAIIRGGPRLTGIDEGGVGGVDEMCSCQVQRSYRSGKLKISYLSLEHGRNNERLGLERISSTELPAESKGYTTWHE